MNARSLPPSATGHPRGTPRLAVTGPKHRGNSARRKVGTNTDDRVVTMAAGPVAIAGKSVADRDGESAQHLEMRVGVGKWSAPETRPVREPTYESYCGRPLGARDRGLLEGVTKYHKGFREAGKAARRPESRDRAQTRSVEGGRAPPCAHDRRARRLDRDSTPSIDTRRRDRVRGLRRIDRDHRMLVHASPKGNRLAA